MKNILKHLILFTSILTLPLTALAYEEEYETASYNRTVGGNVYGSIQLVDTLPIVQMGIGGGLYFDYRFNPKFSLMIETFFTFQDGKGVSAAENTITFLAIPAATFKIYFFQNLPQIDPYVGIGIGLYGLFEGDVANATQGYGIGAQIEVGLEYNIAANLVLGVGGTYRSVGLINSLTGTANASTYMPYTLFGRVGYRF